MRGFKSRVTGFLLEIRTSFWFIPGIIVAAGLALASLLIEVDSRVGYEALQHWPRLFGAGSDGSRSMLSALATSMITVAGVTFSITMVALAQTSAMYSPRLLRTFMGDRSTQLVLGMFVGLFAYCLVVLRSISGNDEVEFIPRISVFAGVVLALISVGFLVFFIHHISSTLQPSNILATVSAETLGAVKNLFPEPLGEPADPRKTARLQEQVVSMNWSAIAAGASGYLQAVTPADLLSFAEENDLVVRMEIGIGDFVVEGDPLVSITHDEAERFADELRAMLPVGMHRTIQQDAGFGIEQLADVAAKALSPSVNDARTAITCIHYLTPILCCLAERQIETPYRCGADDRLRVIAIGPTFHSLMRLGFDPVLRNIGNRRDVFEAVISAIRVIARRAGEESRKQTLEPLLLRVRTSANDSVRDDVNRNELLTYISTVANEIRSV